MIKSLRWGSIYAQIASSPFGIGGLAVLAPKREQKVGLCLFLGPVWVEIGVEWD